MNTRENAAVYFLASDVRHARVGEEGVILRQSEGEVLVVNEVAARLVEMMDGKLTVDQITSVLLEEFAIDRDTLAADLVRFCQELEQAGIALTH